MDNYTKGANLRSAVATLTGAYLRHGPQLELERCPHCAVARPTLTQLWHIQTADHSGQIKWHWANYVCSSCGRISLAVSRENEAQPIVEIWPQPNEVSDLIPERARDFLRQAIASIHAPAGAVMLAASAVDAMLKAKGYKDGNLFPRIEKAAADHAITREMALWAHDIRLDANSQRHADENAPLPNEADANRVIEFASALAQFMFVLPAQVEEGRRGAIADAAS